MSTEGESGRKTVTCPTCNTENEAKQGAHCSECSTPLNIIPTTGGKVRAIGGKIIPGSGRLIR